MPACADDLSPAACWCQKSPSQLRPEHARTARVPGLEKIGPRSHFPADAHATNLVDVGSNNATQERQKFMNLRDPRSRFSRQTLYGVIAIVCVTWLRWSSPWVLAQEAPDAQSQEMATEEAPKVPNDQLDSLVAPIALYPDAMLAQTLAASTYPLEVMQLDQWMDKNKNLKDKALADAVAKQPWDPSVQAMAAFPEVVQR